VDKLIPTIIFGLAVTTTAWADCIIKQKQVAKSTDVIIERSNIKRWIVPEPNNAKKCVVDFSVRIKQNWYRAYGEYVWDGDRPSGEACAAAVSMAEK